MTALPRTERRDDANLAGFARSVSRRRRIALLVFAVMMAGVMAIAVLTPKTYTSSAEIMSKRASRAVGNDAALPVVQSLLTDGAEPTIETYAALAQRYSVAQQVVDGLQPRLSAKEFIERHLVVSPLTNTNVVRVSVSWRDPQTAAAAANAMANAFIEQDRQAEVARAQFAITTLSGTLTDAQRDVDRADAALTHFQTSHAIADVGAQTAALVAQLAGVNTKIGQLSADRRDGQAQLDDVAQQLATTGSRIEGDRNVTGSPVAENLRITLGKSEADLEAARAQFTEQYPTVVALRRQSENLKAQLAALPSKDVTSVSIPNPIVAHLRDRASVMQGQISGDSSQIGELEDQSVALSARLRTLPKEASTLAALQRRAKSAETVLDALQNRYYQALVAKSVASSEISLVDPATAENAERRPKLALTLLAGLLLSLAGAFSTAFLLDRTDHAVRDRDDVARGIPVPILASVGDMRRSAALASASGKELLSLISTLRHNGSAPVRSLAIVSPLSGDGKTTIALNAATRFAGQGTTLLVDANFRRPSLHEHFKVPASPGLADVLAGRARLTDLTVHTDVKGLDFLPAGDDVSASSRSINVERLREILAGRGGAAYDMIVFDTSATTDAPETFDVAAAADGTILVVSEGTTDLELARQSFESITDVWHGRVIGTVVNRSRGLQQIDPFDHRQQQNVVFALPTKPAVAAGPRA